MIDAGIAIIVSILILDAILWCVMFLAMIDDNEDGMSIWEIQIG